MQTHSNLNLNLGTINEEGSYVSAEDEDCVHGDELADDISRLSMDDEYSFDTVTTAYKSEAHKATRAARHHAPATGEAVGTPKGTPKRSIEKIHGNTKIGLPFLLDCWRDCFGHARTSVQVQTLSGRDAYKKIFVRVSTDSKELVLTLPMSPYMSRSDFAFNTFLLAEHDAKMSETDRHYMMLLLKHHPKCAARMVAVAKIKGRSYTDGFFYEQRIRLPRKVQHKFATCQSGDDLFTGKKFVEYPDGSVFLHVELIAEAMDSYIPEERMLDPKHMKSVPKTATDAGPSAMETESTENGARVLPDEEDNETERTRSKRTRTQEHVVETVNSNGSDDDDSVVDYDEDSEEEMSHKSSASALAQAVAQAAAAAKKADAAAHAEGARQKAASVLAQADEQHKKKSSLQTAVEQGKKAAAATGN